MGPDFYPVLKVRVLKYVSPSDPVSPSSVQEYRVFVHRKDVPEPVPDLPEHLEVDRNRLLDVVYHPNQEEELKNEYDGVVLR